MDVRRVTSEKNCDHSRGRSHSVHAPSFTFIKDAIGNGNGNGNGAQMGIDAVGTRVKTDGPNPEEVRSLERRRGGQCSEPSQAFAGSALTLQLAQLANL